MSEIVGWSSLVLCICLALASTGVFAEYTHKEGEIVARFFSPEHFRLMESGQRLYFVPIPAFLALATFAFGMSDKKHPKILLWVLVGSGGGAILAIFQAWLWWGDIRHPPTHKLLALFAAAGFAAVLLCSARLRSTAATHS